MTTKLGLHYPWQISVTVAVVTSLSSISSSICDQPRFRDSPRARCVVHVICARGSRAGISPAGRPYTYIRKCGGGRRNEASIRYTYTAGRGYPRERVENEYLNMDQNNDGAKNL